MLKPVPDWFEKTTIHRDYKGPQFVVLWAILLAGAALRFWNLGYAGFWGDEDLMALAVRGVLAQGEPILPAGWFYSRALGHTYIMAGSVALFGDTEWAHRLPSAVVGSFAGLLAFLLGRRFLEPKFNLLFVALIVFSPTMIAMSQTARMYIFFVVLVLAFAVLVFRWERTEKATDLVLATGVFVAALAFHTLTLFAALLFLFPGVLKRSWSLVAQGGAALGLAYGAQSVISNFQRSFYPSLDHPGGGEDEAGFELAGASLMDWSRPFLAGDWEGWFSVGISLIAAILVIRLLLDAHRTHLRWAVLLLGVGVVACAFLHYHMGVMALLAGTIAWFRSGHRNHKALLAVFLSIGLMAVAQYVFLYTGGLFAGLRFEGLRVLDAMMGSPTVWPMVRLALLSPLAFLLYSIIGAVMLLRFARGARLPDHFLFFGMAVWGPAFIMGVFGLPQARYIYGVFPFALLALVAALAYVFRQAQDAADFRIWSRWTNVVLVVIALIVVNPLDVLRVSANDFRTRPDHKGAAEYIKSLALKPEDIIIAEDSINQTYYLGRVNYRLWYSASHAVFRDGRFYAMYTGTPLITTGEQLESVLDEADGGRVYIIGSAESRMERRREVAGIGEVLESKRLEVVYEGRDGKTTVWRLTPGY